MIRSQSELKTTATDIEDVRIASFVLSGQKSLDLKQYHSMKNLTFGINALDKISKLELIGLEELDSVVIMRGGLSGGSGLVKVTNCANLISIDIGEFAFIKYKSLELVDLPRIQNIRMENNAFQNTQSIKLNSNREKELIIRLGITSIHSTGK